MNLPTYFADFLKNVRPTAVQQNQAAEAHHRLRTLLLADAELNEIIITTFLQGSYRRSTDVKPTAGKKSDVDVIVVTTIDQSQYSPSQALNKFRPFLEKHYSGHFELQGRSWGIVDGEVELDLVPTSAPSEAVRTELSSLRESASAFELGLPSYHELRKIAALEKGSEWREEPLQIPDREAKCWHPTHPIAQIEWTSDKNASCNGNYVDVVRSIKWWRLNDSPGKHPKGYPLEAIVGSGCPDDIPDIATGVVQSAEIIVSTYNADYRNGRLPHLCDHGVPEHNVLGRMSAEEFKSFYEAATNLATRARAALDEPNKSQSIKLWRDVFGPEFPSDDDDGDERKFTPPQAPPSAVPRGRFAR